MENPNIIDHIKENIEIDSNNKLIKENKGKKSFIQFIKFGLVGVSNTLVSYIIYSIWYHILHANVHISNLFAFIISVLWAFIMQSIFVFKETEDGEKRVWWKVLIKTYIAYAFTGLFLTELLLVLWIEIINISQYLTPLSEFLRNNTFINLNNEDFAVQVAPLINMVFTIPINFCVNKFWAYRQNKKEK